MAQVAAIGPRLGVRATCQALGVSPATYYRSRSGQSSRSGSKPPRSLTEPERERILSVLHEPRFVDLAPGQVYAQLLDKGTYLCSERTMYRILEANQEVKERRNQRRHPQYKAPELLATRPNEVWSWDITKLKGPVKWSVFQLYVILDIFSRFVVGWMVAHRESAVLAKRLIGASCDRQGVEPNQLTLHADRGSSMKSKPVAFLLADLGVTKTHSRPQVSNDNPYSEAQFKTLKYRPQFPDRFGCLEDARSFCQEFFTWYNTEHRHSGLGMLTPHDVHLGLAEERLKQRAIILAKAHRDHPERFVRGRPKPKELPNEVWINKPASSTSGENGPCCRSGTPEISALTASMEATFQSKRESEVFAH